MILHVFDTVFTKILINYWKLHTNAYANFLDYSSYTGGRSDPLRLQSCADDLWTMCLFQICTAVGAFLQNYLKNARCTVFFDSGRTYFNTQNAFSV